jgi:biopolymer transport protein ExbD
MSEVAQETNENNKHRSKKSKKASVFIDMTPMVDLAFLLLTFFMLTAVFLKPRALVVQLPNDKSPVDANWKNVMNLILASDDKLYYYFGTDDNVQLVKTDYSIGGLQKILFKPEYQSNKNFKVLIKTAQNVKYKNLVDIFDVVRITSTPNALGEMTKAEKERLAQL